MRLSVTQSSKTGLKREQVSRQRVARRRKKFLCFDFDREAWNSWWVCAGQQLNLCRKLAGLYDQLFVRCHQRSVCKFPTFRRIRASLASTVNNATTTQRNLSAGFSKSTISFSQRRLLFFKVQRHAGSSCQRRTLWICQWRIRVGATSSSRESSSLFGFRFFQFSSSLAPFWDGKYRIFQVK